MTVATLREQSYWSATAPAPQITERTWPQRVDVAIVGGGYTGLAAARELARRGAHVAVLEAYTFGWGASSRNGGMALTGLKESMSATIRRFGTETARALFRTSLEAVAYVERLVHEEEIDCEFARCGHLELAWKPSHFEALQREAELLERVFGHHVHVIPRSALHTETATDYYHGALLDEASGGLHPAKDASGLATAADRAGAWLFERCRVNAIERTNGAFALQTTRGTLCANAVLIATNGYTSSLTPEIQRRVIPIGSYIIATDPLPAELAQAISPKRRMMYDTKHFLFYYRLSSDNRMIFGGRAAFFPEGPDTVRKSAAILHKSMSQVYPQLAHARVEYAWGGTLAFTFDLIPHAGQTRDGLYYALGCGGHGVALLSYLGACMGCHIAGEKVDNPFFTLPFPTAPLGLYDGRPWFLPLVGAYYRLRDWLA
ncbi:MAG: FAD-binding oxidoreductase [Thermoflexales bacterium]|nr:FAD-binding oxidoreductase [Thermoflexales bacterium]